MSIFPLRIHGPTVFTDLCTSHYSYYSFVESEVFGNSHFHSYSRFIAF